MNLVSQYAFGYYLLCFLLGALYAFFLYRNDKRLKEFSKALVLSLAGLRFLAVSFIAILLLAPLVKYFSKTVEKPIIVLAVDQSASMQNQNNAPTINYNSIVSALKNDLASNYELAVFGFDEKVQPLEDSLNFEGKASNFEVLFNSINNRLVNRNLAGMVLLTDGIYNQGSNPLYFENQVNFPIYAIAAGDTNKYKDAKILAVRNNKIAFLGNDFPVEIDLKVDRANGEKLQLEILKGSESIYKKQLEVAGSSITTTIATAINAKQLGMQKYTVRLSKLAEEEQLSNNTYDFYIDVLDGRQKIALLGVSPHPDMAAIKSSLTGNENYEVKTSLLKEFSENVKDYDLLILHNGNQQKAILQPGFEKQVLESSIPILMIGNGWEALSLNLGIGTGGANQRAGVNLVYPKYNESFTFFTLSEELKKQLERFPPINVSASTSTENRVNGVLLLQKIGSVETSYPLFSFHDREGRKIGKFYGDGIWKWSMNDFVENKNKKQFNELLSKTVQYLALKADRSFFRLNVAQEFYEGDPIVFDAQLFNQSYEPVNQAEVKLTLIDEAEREFNYVLNPYKNAYRLIIPSLESGNYSYRAKVNLDGKEYTEKGSLLVKVLQLEQMELLANHNLLFQLAEKSGGELIQLNESSKIAALLKTRTDIHTISYANESLEELINLRWLFFILIGLISLEWFIRKYQGAY
tara:strand:+ start:46638 stop:48716 length:2079 start_codon:yes stop_codon:yes gene_type:complete